MIKHIKVTSLLWLTIVAVYPINAQQHKEYTLGKIWSKVERNYPGIGAEISAVEAAKLNERVIKSGTLPQLSAQAQNTYGTFEGSAGAFFPQPGLFNVSGSAIPLQGSSTTANSFGSAVVEWELFSFGKNRNHKKAATTLYHKSVSEKDAYLLKLKKTLSQRYIFLLYNDAKLKLSEKNVQRLNEILKITSRLSASGLRPAADSLLASSSHIQALGEHDKWEGLKNASIIKLLELYNEDTIVYAASAKQFSNPVENGLNQKRIINTAHPILDALEMQSEYFKLSGKAEKRASLPSISLLGGYAFRATGINPNGTVSGAWEEGFKNSTNNFLAGIGITWNLTNLVTNRIKGEQLLKEAESAELLHSQYQQGMQADLSASQAKIIQQYQQLQKALLAVKQSEDAYRMYLARYKSGLITLSELLQIRSMLEQAENAHIEVSRDYWVLLTYQAELTADFEYLFNNL